jgi:hypothetical protein
MTIRQITRLFRNLWRQSPRLAVRVLVRHVVIALGGDGLVKVPTPPEERPRVTPTGDRLHATASYRSAGTGPLITVYRRTRKSALVTEVGGAAGSD